MSLGQFFKKIFIFCLFILFLTTGIFCFVKNGLAAITPEEAIKNAEQVELKEKDAKMIMRGLIQKISNNWVEIVSSPDMKIEEELVMALMGKAIRTDVANYLLVDVPIEVGKEVLKASVNIAKLLVGYDPSGVIGQIEELSVEKAKEYSTEWLYQNQIKISSGELSLSYKDVIGNYQNFTLPYIIAFKKIDNERADVNIGVYSSKTIEVPQPIIAIPWEGGIEDLSPFILRITGIVEKSFWTYSWSNNPQIRIIFNESVPEFSFPKQSLLDKAKNYVEDLIPDFDFLNADIGRELRSIGTTNTNTDNSNSNNTLASEENYYKNGDSLNKDKIENIEETEKKEETKNTSPYNNEKPKQEIGQQINLKEIEKTLDDIKKQVDSLIKEVGELSKNESPKENVEEEDEDENEEIENIEDLDDSAKTTTKKSSVSTGGGSSSSSPIIYCSKDSSIEAMQDKIVINEIAWMGTNESSNNEWIELKNISEEEINLSGWQILDKDNQIKIVFSGSDIIPSQGFYLLERTDDNSVPDISANYIYTGSLNDSSEELYIFDNECLLQDKVSANPDWEAGNKEEKRTMERGDDLMWHTYIGDGTNNIFGTPLAENSEIEIPYVPTFNNSPWPMYQGNLGRNGQAISQGPSSQPSVQWVYSNSEDINYNFIYTSPIIDDAGIIYTSIISSSINTGILSLNSDGAEKEFEEKNISVSLMGKESEIIADDKLSQAAKEDGSYYYSSGNILFAFDENSASKWQMTFEKSEEACEQADPYLMNPIVGKDGMIYVIVREKDCNDYGDKIDFLYIVSPNNAIISEINLGGFGTNSLSVSSDGIVYLVNAYYGKYSIGSIGSLKGFYSEELKWAYELWENTNSSSYSLPIIDSLGNIYFIYENNLLAFDKEGNKLWELLIDITPNNWYSTNNLGMALSSDGTIYISGKGAIIAVR